MTDEQSRTGASRRAVRSTRSGHSSPLVNSEAARQVSEAARAVGLSVPQLVDLISDSGLMATPPPDGATEVLSLQDLGDRLHALSSAEPRGARAEWFASLLPRQQQALLTVLRERGYATAVIAQEYGIDPMQVVEAHNKFADNLGKNVVQVRMTTLAGQMTLAMERAQQGAMESKDWSTFWRIQKEAIGLLQSMGIVDRAAQKITIDQNVSIGVEEKNAEIRRLIELERRGEARRLEIQRAEREDDEVPTDVQVDSQEDDGVGEKGQRLHQGEHGDPALEAPGGAGEATRGDGAPCDDGRK